MTTRYVSGSSTVASVHSRPYALERVETTTCCYSASISSELVEKTLET